MSTTRKPRPDSSPPGHHLAFLVEKLIDDQGQQKQLLLQARSRRANERLQVLKHLELINPGIAKRLSEAWPKEGRQSVFLWDLVSINGWSDKKLRDVLIERGIELTGEWEKAPKGRKGAEARVLEIRYRKVEIGVLVRLNKPASIPYEDSRHLDIMQSRDVEILVRKFDKKHMALVFCSQLDGKKALAVFLSWLLGYALSTTKTDFSKAAKPITFHAQDIKRIAARNKWKKIAVKSVHPDGNKGVGKVTYEGPPAEDGSTTPLDDSVDIINAQDQASVRQFNRTCMFNYTHSDGFKEPSHAKFDYESTHPHLLFELRTSRPAVSYVVDELYAEVG